MALRSPLSRALAITVAAGAGLAGIAAPATAADAEDGTLRFAMISDIQYTDVANPSNDFDANRFYRHSPEKLEAAAAVINADDSTDFTVHTGDMGDRFRADFGQIMPYFRAIEGTRYNILGNHDYNEGMTTAEAVAATDMSEPYYDVVEEGWRLVFLNSNEISTYAAAGDEAKLAEATAAMEALDAEGKIYAKPWNGAFGEEQLAWLDGVLADAKSKDQPVMVFMHHPVFGENSHNAWDSEAAQEVLAKHGNVEAVFNGHDHAGRYAYEDGIHYLNQRGFVENPSPDAAWSFVTVEEDGIRVDGQHSQEDFFLPFGEKATNSYLAGEGDIPVTAEIPARDGEGTDPTGPGSLVMSIAEGGLTLGDARNAGDRLRLAGVLPAVSVTDTRAAGSWAVTGQASDLTSGEATVRAENLGWEPFVAAGDAVAGEAVAPKLAGGTGLAAPVRLGTGTAAADQQQGTAELAADVRLEVPVDTTAGSYTGGVTVSLFPQD